jgi:[ribosomal protein S5]-alanine N-acetyltransferase
MRELNANSFRGIPPFRVPQLPRRPVGPGLDEGVLRSWQFGSLRITCKTHRVGRPAALRCPSPTRHREGIMANTDDFQESNFLECACPFCGQSLSFPVTYINTAQTCIRCMEVVIVPDDDAKSAKKLPLPLTTSRLQLRRFRPDDWKDVREWYDDEGDGAAYDEEAVRWLESDAKSKLSEGQYLCLAMEMTSSGKVIGWVGIQYLQDTREQAAVHGVVNRQFQRQGYATEAVSAMLVFGFEGLHLHRITASAFSQETGRCRMLERVGMRREGEFLKDHLVEGEWQSTSWYAMLASEFRERSATQ